jgi:hypothetical protein
MKTPQMVGRACLDQINAAHDRGGWLCTPIPLARTVIGSGGPACCQQPTSPEPGTQEPDLAERLAYSIDETARLTGLSRDLFYDEMRRGNLTM